MYFYVIVLVGSLFSIFVASADKGDIVVKTASESWISSVNFADIVQVSLNSSKCCNVFIFGQSPRIHIIFNKFIEIYHHPFQLNNRTYDCDGYFVISESVDRLVTKMRRVPTTISTTKVLIVVDDDVKQGSGLLNVSFYENSDVNIVAANGLWTLSEMYILPRVFSNVSSYHQMVHNREVVNLRGQQLQAATFYKPPFSYLNSTVNRTVNGIDGEFFITSNRSELDGIEVKLFMLIADRLNFTWTIRRPKNGERYGKRNGTKWSGGVIGQIFDKEVDIAFGTVWVTLHKYPFANTTHPWTQHALRFLVPRPKRYSSFWALIKPLTPEVWCAVITMLIAQSIYVCTRAHIDRRIPKRFRSFVITWTEMMGRLVGSVGLNDMQALKLQLQLWHAIGILLVTAYSSNLAARLASRGFEKRIDTREDFIEANMTWGTEGPPPIHSTMFDMHDPFIRQLSTRFQQEKSETDRHRKILNGNYAIVGRIFGTTFFPIESVRNEDLANYRVMKESVGQFSTAFVVQPWLLPSVNRVMLQLLANGLVHYHIWEVLDRRSMSAFREVLLEKDASEGLPRVLDLTPLGVGFSILILGLLSSTVVFFFELKYVHGSKSMREVLMKIKKNREFWRVRKLKRRSGYPVLKTVETNNEITFRSRMTNLKDFERFRKSTDVRK